MIGRPATKLRPPRRGEAITADFLQRQAARVDANTGALSAPRDVSAEEDTTAGVTYTEVSRTSSTVDVSGVEIERIDSVTFEHETTGERLTLVFDND